MAKVILKISDNIDSKSFCYPFKRIDRKDQSNLDVRKIKKILFEDYKQTFDQIELVGGINGHPDLDSILKEIKKQKSTFLIIHGGAEDLSRKINDFKKHKVNALKLFLAGVSEKENDQVLGKGSFKKFLKNIKEARKENLAIMVDFLITKKNWQNLPLIFRFFKENHLDAIWSELAPLGDGEINKSLILDDEENLVILWNSLRSWGLKNNYPIKGFSNFLENHPSCRFAEIFFIDAQGETQQCYLSEDYFLKKGRDNDFNKKRCASCFDWKLRVSKNKFLGQLIKDALKSARSLKQVDDAFKQVKNNQIVRSNSDNIAESSLSELRSDDILSVARQFDLIKLMDEVDFNWIKYYFEIPDNIEIDLEGGHEKKNILNELSLFSIKNIFVRGTGNSLDSVGKIFSYFKKRNNFLILDLEGWRTDNLKKIVKNPNIKGFSLNMYGASSKKHDSLTKEEGSFDKIMDMLEIIMENKKSLYLNYILTNKNILELDQMIDFSGMLEVPFFNVIPLDQINQEEKGRKIDKKLIPGANVIKRARRECIKAPKRGIATDCKLVKKIKFHPFISLLTSLNKKEPKSFFSILLRS